MNVADLEQSDQPTIWEPMIIEGEFILHWVADTYLLNDFEHSLRISTTDFSYVANTALFEANILRFRALASLKLFHHFDFTEEENLREGYDYLMKAIESMLNALQIYQAIDEESINQKNNYGMALSNYALGYIYKFFSKDLCRNVIKPGTIDEENE